MTRTIGLILASSQGRGKTAWFDTRTGLAYGSHHMHCVDCGTQNLDSTRYCKSCGANLEVVRQALTQNLSSGPATMIGPRHVGLILMLATFGGIFGLGIVFGFIVSLARAIGPSLGNGLLPLLMLLGLFGVAG